MRQAGHVGGSEAPWKLRRAAGSGLQRLSNIEAVKKRKVGDCFVRRRSPNHGVAATAEVNSADRGGARASCAPANGIAMDGGGGGGGKGQRAGVIAAIWRKVRWVGIVTTLCKQHTEANKGRRLAHGRISWYGPIARIRRRLRRGWNTGCAGTIKLLQQVQRDANVDETGRSIRMAASSGASTAMRGIRTSSWDWRLTASGDFAKDGMRLVQDGDSGMKHRGSG